KIRKAKETTANNKGLALNIAANYGGRWDITQAAQKVSELCVAGELQPSDITEGLLGQHVSLADLPEPDLCIRTAGEQRISNFLIWQFAYTEFYYADCYWPDFNKAKLEEAFVSFGNRERRFGRTSEQLEAEKNG
ncbi:MAG: polyprenyl diphosphate synthase, partial [Pontibacterium sp.]